TSHPLYQQSHTVFSSSRHSFFFTHTAPTEIYTLSLHDALPISSMPAAYNGFKSYWTAKSAGARASSGGEFPIVHSGWTTWVLRSYKALPRTLTCGVGRKSWSGVIPAITGARAAGICGSRLLAECAWPLTT